MLKTTLFPVHQISIIPRGMAAGFTMYLPTEDKGHISRTKLIEDICSLLGGRAAEQLTQEDICTGASNDIERATQLARQMITRYGMSEKLGPIVFGKDDSEVLLGRDFSSTPNYSEIATKAPIRICENEKISGEQFVDIMEGKLTNLLTEEN